MFESLSWLGGVRLRFWAKLNLICTCVLHHTTPHHIILISVVFKLISLPSYTYTSFVFPFTRIVESSHFFSYRMLLNPALSRIRRRSLPNAVISSDLEPRTHAWASAPRVVSSPTYASSFSGP
jgi:hypothetical protein